MPHSKPKLTDMETLNFARRHLQKYLSLEADGRLCSTEILLDLLLAVAVQRGTLEALCADLVNVPDAETLRRYLNDQLDLEDLPALEAELNAALHAVLPPGLRGTQVEAACDLHDRPYYGRTSQEEGGWVRGEAKAGTTRCYRVATIYTLRGGQRVTLGVKFVQASHSNVDIVTHLLDLAEEAGVRLGILYADKGFAGVEVQKYLALRGQRAVIACAIRGKKGGTRALCVGRGSYRGQHTFGKGAKQHTAEVAVCRVKVKRGGKQGKMGWLVYILLGVEWSPAKVKRRYRRRFGIESSYRSGKQVSGWTTSPNGAYRFLLIGLGFYVSNCWVSLRWDVGRVVQRGGIRVEEGVLRLKRVAAFIRRAVERRYQVVESVECVSPPRGKSPLNDVVWIY